MAGPEEGSRPGTNMSTKSRVTMSRASTKAGKGGKKGSLSRKNSHLEMFAESEMPLEGLEETVFEEEEQPLESQPLEKPDTPVEDIPFPRKRKKVRSILKERHQKEKKVIREASIYFLQRRTSVVDMAMNAQLEKMDKGRVKFEDDSSDSEDEFEKKVRKIKRDRRRPSVRKVSLKPAEISGLGSPSVSAEWTQSLRETSSLTSPNRPTKKKNQLMEEVPSDQEEIDRLFRNHDEPPQAVRQSTLEVRREVDDVVVSSLRQLLDYMNLYDETALKNIMSRSGLLVPTKIAYSPDTFTYLHETVKSRADDFDLTKAYGKSKVPLYKSSKDDRLSSIFRFYAGLSLAGDVTNTSTWTLGKWRKFGNDVKVSPQKISGVDWEILFKDILRVEDCKAVITYNVYRRALQRLAATLYHPERSWRELNEKEQDDCEKSFLEEYVYPNAHSMQDKRERESDFAGEMILHELQAHHIVLAQVYAFYAGAVLPTVARPAMETTWDEVKGSKLSVDFDELWMLCNNFMISPQMVSRRQLAHIFYASNFGQSHDNDEETLSFAEFCEVLCRIAVASYAPNYAKKFMSRAETMNSSNFYDSQPEDAYAAFEYWMRKYPETSDPLRQSSMDAASKAGLPTIYMGVVPNNVRDMEQTLKRRPLPTKRVTEGGAVTKSPLDWIPEDRMHLVYPHGMQDRNKEMRETWDKRKAKLQEAKMKGHQSKRNHELRKLQKIKLNRTELLERSGVFPRIDARVKQHRSKRETLSPELILEWKVEDRSISEWDLPGDGVTLKAQLSEGSLPPIRSASAPPDLIEVESIPDRSPRAPPIRSPDPAATYIRLEDRVSPSISRLTFQYNKKPYWELNRLDFTLDDDPAIRNSFVDEMKSMTEAQCRFDRVAFSDSATVDGALLYHKNDTTMKGLRRASVNQRLGMMAISKIMNEAGH